MKKIVIIGASAAGNSLATRLRRLDENLKITLIENSDTISFAICGIPYFISNITEAEELLIKDDSFFKERYNIEVYLSTKVTSVDSVAKKINIEKSGKKDCIEYDSLVISTGIKSLNDSKIDSIISLDNFDDLRSLDEIINKTDNRALVIGNTSKACLIAYHLKKRGLETTISTKSNQLLDNMDFEMAQIIHRLFLEEGLELKLGKDYTQEEEIDKFDIIINLESFIPYTNFLSGTGICLDDNGFIKVNKKLETNVDNIYSIGDVCVVDNYNENLLNSRSITQSRILANNIVNKIKEDYDEIKLNFFVKLFDLNCSSIGYNEKDLIKKGKVKYKDYLVSFIQSNSHSSFIPGPSGITLKVLFDSQSHKILGATIVGYEGVDKRIDIISTAMKFGAKITDLSNIDLSYTPEISTNRDPIHIVGDVSKNIIEGLVENCSYEALDKDVILLDVRTNEEFNLNHINGAINIPLKEIRDRLDELDKNKTYVVYCAAGLRGYLANRILIQNGFSNIKNLAGGYSAFASYTCKLEDVVCIDTKTIYDYDEGGDVDMIRDTGVVEVLNVSSQQCPGPILSVANKMKELNDGDVLEIKATDPGFYRDIAAWCKSTKNTLINVDKNDNIIKAKVKKGSITSHNLKPAEIANDKTIVLFSGDLDKAIAALIIANGAISMGRNVTIFFTFWGLNVLRKSQKVKVKKNFLQKMFSIMMPRGTKKLSLSKMNFFGMGPKFIRKIMKDENVDQIEVLLNKAKEAGVRLIACNMSMDLMGIKTEELIEGVDLGGVATYLSDAENSDTNLFI